METLGLGKNIFGNQLILIYFVRKQSSRCMGLNRFFSFTTQNLKQEVFSFEVGFLKQ